MSEDVLDSLDRVGRELSLGEWIELLEQVQEGVQARLDAARDDLLNQQQEMIRFSQRKRR